jgi:hypothetical protein
MIRRQRDRDPVVITDAARSFDEELRSRRRRYAILMVVHVAGFALAGVLYYLVGWWLGLALLIVTGVLPWIAVVMANDEIPRAARAEHLMHNIDSDPQEFAGPDQRRQPRRLLRPDRATLPPRRRAAPTNKGQLPTRR